MNKKPSISTLFLDIGGVLLSDGWDHYSRKAAAKLFNLDYSDMEERHRINFETYELGKMTFKEYLNRVIFYKKQSFLSNDFKKFIYQQSTSHPKMIALFIHLKKEYGLKIGVISNEGRELNEYRIKKFKLNRFIDFFISSSFVNMRKPDTAIFRMALDIAQVNVSESIFIDNQPLFVKIAQEFGMKGICHSDYESTVLKLHSFGLDMLPTTNHV